jgi:hypothetical protein
MSIFNRMKDFDPAFADIHLVKDAYKYSLGNSVADTEKYIKELKKQTRNKPTIKSLDEVLEEKKQKELLTIK